MTLTMLTYIQDYKSPKVLDEHLLLVSPRGGPWVKDFCIMICIPHQIKLHCNMKAWSLFHQNKVIGMILRQVQVEWCQNDLDMFKSKNTLTHFTYTPEAQIFVSFTVTIKDAGFWKFLKYLADDETPWAIHMFQTHLTFVLFWKGNFVTSCMNEITECTATLPLWFPLRISSLRLGPRLFQLLWGQQEYWENVGKSCWSCRWWNIGPVRSWSLPILQASGAAAADCQPEISHQCHINNFLEKCCSVNSCTGMLLKGM